MRARARRPPYLSALFPPSLPTSCKHGDEGRCIHCTPLEPYDEQVLNASDPPIKFLSFQSYLRKLNSGADHGRLTKLEELDCKIKPCTAHAPWPKGICTRCQPSAVTLQRQVGLYTGSTARGSARIPFPRSPAVGPPLAGSSTPLPCSFARLLSRATVTWTTSSLKTRKCSTTLSAPGGRRATSVLATSTAATTCTTRCVV